MTVVRRERSPVRVKNNIFFWLFFVVATSIKKGGGVEKENLADFIWFAYVKRSIKGKIQGRGRGWLIVEG